MDNINRIVVAGHRGYKTKYPENTLISFQEALNIGVDMIEFDIHLSKDKKLVVIHDETLERTTNGKGYVRDLMLSELKELDAGYWFSKAYEGIKIPTLDELLELISGDKKLLLNVEIKEKTHETVDLTIETLRKAGVIDRAVIACFDASIVKYAKERHGMRCQGFPGFLMQNFEEGDHGSYSYMYSVGIDKKYLTKEMIAHFERLNILPWSYCMDDEESTLSIIGTGVTLITCNDPAPALKILKEKGYHE